jgi:hypothetical protein
MRILLFNPRKKYKVIHRFVDGRRPPRKRTWDHLRLVYAKREPQGVRGHIEMKHYKIRRKGRIIVLASENPFCLFSYEHQSNQRS